MLQNNQEITEEIEEEIKKHLKTNDNENITQNIWDAIKAVARTKFIAIKSYFKKQGKHQISNITLHIKQLKRSKNIRHW